MDKFLPLICHPDTPARRVDGVSVSIRRDGDRWVLAYAVTGDAALIPAAVPPQRIDGLWQTTCFEMFVADEKGGYTEFNFSPSTQWAAYSFHGYRTGMANVPVDPPHIEPTDEGFRVELTFPTSPNARLSLSAVIEEQDGTKSYWALRHPPGKPDFHHPDCFALLLSAGKGA